ncbi:MAG TPA: response regulator [Gemmatimonadales bacterium]|nr:response regulator [Gemmatimonadales bacterium]
MGSPPRHLLVVDDEPHIGVLLRLHFEPRGYRLSFARTLAEARQALARGTPDALLLDLHLPDGLGLDLLGEVRRSSATRGLPVLVLTAEGDERLLGETGRLGATVLTKPFSPTKLTARVLEMLGEPPGPPEPDGGAR